MSVRRTAPKRASIILSYTWSTIFEDSDVEDQGGDYSVSEISESFTLRRLENSVSLSPTTDTINEDTDVEADDDFEELSEVTFQPVDVNDSELKVVGASQRVRKSTIMNNTNPMLNPQNHSKCSTHCASTYHTSRDRRRRAVSSVVSPQIFSTNKKIVSTSEDTSLDESSDELAKLRVRKKSKFNPQKHQTQMIEGTFKLEASKNYEEFLAAIGTGPCSQDMVMRADMVMVISQEPDKQWRIANETLIKAKSVRGYRTNNRKWTENKFKAGEAKPELLDDWDQRLIVTTLNVDTEGTTLELNQIAEKDQWNCKDSTLVLEVDPMEKDTLIMTCMVDDVVAWRKFQRQTSSKFSRKISAPF